MSLTKHALIFILLGLSLNTFACRPSSQMSGSLMPLGGIVTKLSETKKFQHYSFQSIEFLPRTYVYKVILKSSRTNSCLSVLMTPTSNGMCKYNATINKVSEVRCI